MTIPDVPGYRFLRPLGGGAHFEVWEVRPTDDIVPRVLKCLRADAADPDAGRALLRREARAGQLVRHPRLLRVVRAHVDDAPYFLLSEPIPGQSLAARLARAGGRLSARNAVWFVRQTAEALAALHAVGLVHADVRPANVRVTPTGETKLIDLASAHRPGENDALRAQGHALGEPAYAAPERNGPGAAEGTAADVYSLGVLLHEALTGRRPGPDESGTAAARWPDRLPELVAAMRDPDPRARPTANRVVRELMRVEVCMLRFGAFPAAGERAA